MTDIDIICNIYSGWNTHMYCHRATLGSFPHAEFAGFLLLLVLSRISCSRLPIHLLLQCKPYF